MKKFIIAFLFFIFSLNNVNASYYNDNFSFCSKLDGAYLIADDGEFLGKLSSNEFDAKSISNSFGTYGSEFNSKSIWNEFGTYGSEFNAKSPWNEFSRKGPLIIKGGKNYGRLTLNSFSNSNFNTFDILRCFVSLSDSRYKPYMKYFKSSNVLQYSYISSSNISYKNKKKDCGINSFLDSDGSCKCKSGYVWKYPDNSKNYDCIKKKSLSDLCKEEFGIYSIPATNGKFSCTCKNGYEWNDKGTYCVKKKICGLNSYLTNDGKCTCKYGYIWKYPNNSNNFDCIKKKTPSEMCQEKYGKYSFYAIDKCACELGYEWNSDKSYCIKEKSRVIINKEKNEKKEKLEKKANIILEKIENRLNGVSDIKKKKTYEKFIKVLTKYSNTKAKGDIKILIDLIINGLKDKLNNIS